jgi:hypothetical protein
MVERVEQIAKATVEHVRSQAKTQEQMMVADQYTVASVLERIEVRRVRDYVEQLASVYNLVALLAQRPNVMHSCMACPLGVSSHFFFFSFFLFFSFLFFFLLQVRTIIFDSFSFALRYSFNDVREKNRLISVISQQLQSVARRYNVAALVTNQMKSGRNSDLTPMLGDKFGSYCDQRVSLFFSETLHSRKAKLEKSSTNALSEAAFVVNADGLRDVAEMQ